MDIPPHEQDLQVLRDLIAAGQQTEDLSSWAAQEGHAATPGLVLEQSVARYAAAEYLCWLWFEQASKDSAAPIAELCAWVQRRPPSQQQLAAWMHQ
jgi:hypothetical protein